MAVQRKSRVFFALLVSSALAVAQGCAHFRSQRARAIAEYAGATWRPAPRPNYSPAARTRADVRWIVIHTSEDDAGDAIQRLTDPAMHVSAHYLVTRDGRVIQLVRDEDVAYGVGNLAYNRACISIEHERYDGAEVTAAELKASRDLVRWLLQRYDVAPRIVSGLAPADPRTGSGIIGHSQVPDLRHTRVGGGENHHTDPINWNWNAYARLLGLPIEH